MLAKTLSKLIIAVIAGGILPLAFAPYNIWPLAILSPAALVWLWSGNDTSAKQCFFTGWLFGIGKYAVGCYWVYISIHRFGGTGVVLAVIITLGFVCFVGLWHAVQGLIFQKLRSKNRFHNLIFLFPASFVLIEWSLNWLFTGFAWLFLGSSQIHSPLAGFIPLFGVLGTTAICAFCGGLFVALLAMQAKAKFLSLFMLLFTFMVGAYATRLHWSKPYKSPITVALVQGNIAQSEHWQASQVPLILDKYQQLSRPYFSMVQLVIWPENAIPLPPPYSDSYLLGMKKIAAKNNSTLITGLPIIHGTGYYNSIMMIGKNSGHYYKRHLVPFGEYLPFASLLRGMINFFNIPMSDFIPGPQQQKLLTVNGINIAPFICYEITFSQLIRKDLPKANILLSISNDAWFGDSAAAWQQLQMAQAQSLAASRPQLAVTNNGITAVINNKGDIVKRLPRSETGVLTAHIQGDSGITPWIIWGHWPALLFSWLILLFFAIKRLSRKNLSGQKSH